MDHREYFFGLRSTARGVGRAVLITSSLKYRGVLRMTFIYLALVVRKSCVRNTT